jgi:hypothetical protein
MAAEMLAKECEAAKVGSTTFNRYADPMQQIYFDLSNQINELKSVFDSPDKQTGSADWENLLDPSLGGGG